MAGRKHLIAKMAGSDGVVQTSGDGIAEVFAQFYEDLYRDLDNHNAPTPSVTRRTTPVTTTEVEQALEQFKNAKTGAYDGLVAEMFKTGH